MADILGDSGRLYSAGAQPASSARRYVALEVLEELILTAFNNGDIYTSLLSASYGTAPSLQEL